MTAIPPEVLAGPPPLTDDDIERLTGEEVPELAEAGDGFGEVAAPAARWQIDGTNSAAWAMAKLGEYERDQAELVRQAAEFHRSIDGWLETELARRRIPRSVAFFRQHLEAWGMAEREASGGKVKTLGLPSGEVKTTQHSPKAVIEDEDVLLVWALVQMQADDPERVKAIDSILKRKVSVKLTELRALVDVVQVADEETGEVRYEAQFDGEPVPGVSVTPGYLEAKAVPS